MTSLDLDPSFELLVFALHVVKDALGQGGDEYDQKNAVQDDAQSADPPENFRQRHQYEGTQRGAGQRAGTADHRRCDGQDGIVQGNLIPTGELPLFYEEAVQSGFPLSKSFFQKP